MRRDKDDVLHHFLKQCPAGSVPPDAAQLQESNAEPLLQDEPENR